VTQLHLEKNNHRVEVVVSFIELFHIKPYPSRAGSEQKVFASQKASVAEVQHNSTEALNGTPQVHTTKERLSII